MTTYAEFQQYYIRKLWRDGDTSFASDLPVQMKQAEARINRDIRHYTLTKTFNDAAYDGTPVILPADYSQAQAVYIENEPAAQVTTRQGLHNINLALTDHDSVYRGRNGQFIAIEGNTLLITSSASIADPLNLTIVYVPKVPAYEDHVTGDSYYDENPDFYLCAVDIYAYDYLMDEVKSSNAIAKYNGLVEDMREDQIRKKFPLGAIHQPMPGQVM